MIPASRRPPHVKPLIDPNEHSCGTVRPFGGRKLVQDDSGLYLAGIKSYGRAPTFLMITGYEQVRSIAADIMPAIARPPNASSSNPETGSVCPRGGVEKVAQPIPHVAVAWPPPASTPAALRTPTPRPSEKLAVGAPEVTTDRQLNVVLALGTTQTLAWSVELLSSGYPCGPDRA